MRKDKVSSCFPVVCAPEGMEKGREGMGVVQFVVASFSKMEVGGRM